MQGSTSATGLRRTLAAVLAVVTTAGAAIAAEPGVSSTEIVIGNTITLQGGKNAYGTAAHTGMKLYFDALNAAGGVNGRRIVLRTLDDDNKTATAESNARKLVQERAFILFAPVERGK